MNNLLGDAAFWVKREVFEALGGFAPTRESWEDYEFLLRLCLRGYDLQVIPGPLYFYALSPQSRKHRARYDANRRSAQRLLDKTPRAVLGAVRPRRLAVSPPPSPLTRGRDRRPAGGFAPARGPYFPFPRFELFKRLLID